MTARIASPAGLVAEVNANGSIRRLSHGDVVLNAFPGTEVEGGPLQLYLRRLDAPIAWTPLLGPRSPLAVRVDADGLRARGAWRGVAVELALVLAADAPAWFWHVALAAEGADALDVDLVYAHDVGLAHWAAIRMNEYYVSQYLDHEPLAHATHGWVVASRQNLAMAGRHPWQAVGALGRAAGFATDALQLHGLATRAGAPPPALEAPRLPSVRLQHEHAMAVVQTEPLHLAPGAPRRTGFWGWFEADHPAATSAADVAVVERALALPAASAPMPATDGAAVAAASLFADAPLLACRDLDAAAVAARWRGERRHVERDDAGRPLSFFTGAHDHVALRAKDLCVLRPHGAILRTGATLVPDEASLTTTVWMQGVFGALLTQGHVGINRFLSTTRSYLSLLRAQGQRLFVELDGRWQLLDEPSAWETTPRGCRWVYEHADVTLVVQVDAPAEEHAIALRLDVERGGPLRVLVAHHVALGGDDGLERAPVRFARDARGVVVHAPPDTDVGRRFPGGAFRVDPLPGTDVERVGGDELLYADGQARGEPFLVLALAPARSAGLRITGELVAATPSDAVGGWADVAGPLRLAVDPASPHAADVARLAEIVPWYVHDALVHYLAPGGPEQFSGGGWGTRDVCQGPVELLLALGHDAPVRDLLLRVFANQNPDGDWPQWFMFFDRERTIRPADSHGDIVFWPLLALAEYLLATGDGALLDEVAPFFHPEGAASAERATVTAHVERALAVIAARVVPGTRLTAYGHGDWNDALQPVDPAMRERLCSAWTMTLHHQTFATLARALRAVGRDAAAAPLDAAAATVGAEFRRHLLVDGVLAGFAYVQPDGRIDHLLHPRDPTTDIHYSLLPMVHAVLADLLTPAEAASHVALIRARLLGMDGARLFDRPPPYRGGPERLFQRAESSSFFGREIGLMYVHAHLRWAQALAHLGDADAFFDALRRLHPIGLDAVVPSARRRQANCYYSSSDAAVADRYEAAARYADVRAGLLPYEGGWRVYSSGAGIAVRLVHEWFLGLRRGRALLGVDPVVPKALDGLLARVTLEGRALDVRYRVAVHGCGPTAVTLNGTALPLTRVANPYRVGGVTVPMATVRAALRADENVMTIELA